MCGTWHFIKTIETKQNKTYLKNARSNGFLKLIKSIISLENGKEQDKPEGK
jgi:hypothetical protein